MIYTLPLLAGVLIALAELSSKFVAEDRHRAETKSLIANIVGMTCAFLLIPFEKLQYSIEPFPILLLFLNGLVMAIGYVLFFASFKRVELPIATLLTKTSVLVFILGGVFLFNEQLTALHIPGTVLIICSFLVLPSLGRMSGIRFSKWMGGLLVAGILFGISVLMDNYLSTYFSPFLYLGLLFAMTALILTLYFLIVDRSLFVLTSRKMLTQQTVSSILSVAGQAFLLNSYRLGGMVSISNILALIRLPIVVLLGILFLKEHDNWQRKVLAMSILVVGLVLLKI